MQSMHATWYFCAMKGLSLKIFFVSETMYFIESVFRNSPEHCSVFLRNTSFDSEDKSFARLKYRLKDAALIVVSPTSVSKKSFTLFSTWLILGKTVKLLYCAVYCTYLVINCVRCSCTWHIVSFFRDQKWSHFEMPTQTMHLPSFESGNFSNFSAIKVFRALSLWWPFT